MLSYDKSTEMVMRVARALVKAAEEHGIPNSFSFSELVGGEAMFAGKAVRKLWVPFCLNVHSRGIPRVELSGGRLHVLPD
jgi:hypothetical protein